MGDAYTNVAKGRETEDGCLFCGAECDESTMCLDVRSCLSRVRKQRDKALAALGRYGRHDPDCPKCVTGAARLRAALAGRARCVCGLDAALADPKT
jgi:hypothetical protein